MTKVLVWKGVFTKASVTVHIPSYGVFFLPVKTWVG